MENNQVPQAPQMPQQPPQQAPQPPYQAPQQPPQQPYQAPQQPYQQAPQQPYQQPYQQAPQAPATIDPDMIFKIVLMLALGITAIVGLIGFIDGFEIFKGSVPAALSIIFSWGLAAAISVISIIRLVNAMKVKDDKAAVLPLLFFIVAFFFNIILMIVLGRFCKLATDYSALTLVLFIVGAVMALLCAIKLNRLNDANSYSGLIQKMETLDYALVGAYAFCTLMIVILAKIG